MCERGQISGAAVALNAQREHRGLRDVHAFSSESIPPRGLSLTHLAGKGLLVACHGHEAEKLAGMARIYIYPEPDLRPAYVERFCSTFRLLYGSNFPAALAQVRANRKARRHFPAR